MIRKYSGVVTKLDNDYVLYTNGEDINLNYILKDLYMKYANTHIKINNDARQLLNEEGEIYLDRDDKKQYKLHINNINVENLLQQNLYKLIDIKIDSEDAYETIHNS